MANTTNHSPEFEANKGRFGSNASDVQRKIASKGGEAKAAKERRKRELKEIMAAVDEMDLTSPAFREGLQSLGFSEEFINELSQKEGAVSALQRERLKGNVKAFEIWAKITGEYTETVNVNDTRMPKDGDDEVYRRTPDEN